MQLQRSLDKSAHCCVYPIYGIIVTMLTLAGSAHALQASADQPANQPTTQPATQPDRQPVTRPTTQPANPAQRNPGQPEATPAPPPATDPGTARPADQKDGVNDTSDPNRTRTNARTDDQPRFNRPFALSNPQDTARVDQAVERLTRLESRLAQSNEARLTQFAGLRSLRGDELTTGLLSTLQQMLRDQQVMGEYLTEARSVWSGDMSGAQAQSDQQGGDDMNSQRNPGAGVAGNSDGTGRFNSPFAMSTQEGLAAFSQQTSQLVEQEDGLRSTATQRLRQLGEVRGMTGERQSQALLDLVQNVLNDQQAMTKYLRDARATWSGDAGMSNPAQPASMRDGQNDQNDQNAQNGSGTQPGGRQNTVAPLNPGQPSNQPSTQPRNPPATQPPATPRPR